MAQESIAILREHNQDIAIETWNGININAVFVNEYEMVTQPARGCWHALSAAERRGIELGD